MREELEEVFCCNQGAPPNIVKFYGMQHLYILAIYSTYLNLSLLAVVIKYLVLFSKKKKKIKYLVLASR